jgi:phosphoglycerol transferase
LRLWLETPDYIHRRGFMPTVVCLGDVLSAAGYRTVFLNGSDLSMFAIRAFLQTHGFDTIVESAQFQGQGLDAHMSGWGYDDHALMIRVDQELGRLAGGDAPFLLAFLTIGTHGPDGVLDATCDPVPPGVPALPTAVACAVGHLDAVLAMLDRHGLAGDTVVAVMSDHLMMENTLQAEFDAVQDRRENLFFLLNAGGPGRIARTGSMLDVYPTLLEALGYRLEGGRAGLGQAFLSPAPTLVEALGEQTASAAIWRHLALAEWLWRSPDD